MKKKAPTTPPTLRWTQWTARTTNSVKGEANLGVEHHVGDDMARLVQDVVFKLCAALVAAPLAGNLSWFSILFFALSAALLGWTFVWKEKKK